MGIGSLSYNVPKDRVSWGVKQAATIMNYGSHGQTRLVLRV